MQRDITRNFDFLFWFLCIFGVQLLAPFVPSNVLDLPPLCSYRLWMISTYIWEKIVVSLTTKTHTSLQPEKHPVYDKFNVWYSTLCYYLPKPLLIRVGLFATKRELKGAWTGNCISYNLPWAVWKGDKFYCKSL